MLKVYSFTQCYKLNVASVQVNVNCEFKDSTTLLISLQMICIFFYHTVCERSTSSEGGEAKAC